MSTENHEQKKTKRAFHRTGDESTWSLPPPGLRLVTEGKVEKGDMFYIQRLGVWAEVPEEGWGEDILREMLIARGELDLAKITPVAHVPLHKDVGIDRDHGPA